MIFFLKMKLRIDNKVFLWETVMDQAQHNLYHSRKFNSMGLSKPSHTVHHYQDHHLHLYPVNVETMGQLKET